MYIIDYYAYTNKMKHINPGEKILFALGSLGWALLARNPLLPMLILAGNIFILNKCAGIPGRILWRLLVLPFTFLLPALLPILLYWQSTPRDLVWFICLGNSFLGIKAAGIQLAQQVAARSLAAVTCLYFISLTTPMPDWREFCRRLHLPPLLLDLMTLVYRYIFILAQTAASMHLAQTLRLGYGGFRPSIRHTALLLANLLQKSYQTMQSINIAMQSRNFQDELPMASREYPWNKRNIVLIISSWIVLLILTQLTGGWQLWNTP
ncbi:cobalt ECF transporter T component CbiQ [Desulfurispora thermophila]|uniref:cobalt ECF transporter T component CbiQ n=1 Tax=Desulfurispora thermophila TaxID=265470 RepID=UPI000375CF9D|nr:cobalt ECF transporter T component CbiQ [Desulfurispora thermophila]